MVAGTAGVGSFLMGRCSGSTASPDDPLRFKLAMEPSEDAVNYVSLHNVVLMVYYTPEAGIAGSIDIAEAGRSSSMPLMIKNARASQNELVRLQHL